MKSVFLVTGLLGLVAAMTSAQALNFAGQSSTSNQSAKSKADERRANSILGRVVNDAGQPIVNARISAGLVGKRGAYRATSTDDDGKFQIENLSRGLYSVSAYAPGYTRSDKTTGPKYCRIGETVNFTLIKGGVITGTVTNSLGEPLIAMRVVAARLRDPEGRTVRNPDSGGEQRTDDRGVFRIYGLLPGTYMVFASGNGFFSDQPTPYDEEAPTYYPSSTRDVATPITLHQGEEITSIDIRHRGEPGHAISGRIKGTPTSIRSCYVELIHATSNQLIGQQYVEMRGDDSPLTFAFYGVPDGEYLLIVRQYIQEEQGGVGRVRAKVKGSDVTDLEISLTPSGSIAGLIALEHMKDKEQKKKCEGRQGMSFDETVISANRDRKTGNVNDSFLQFLFPSLDVPTGKGEFTINNIEAGSYHLEPVSISDGWYLRAVTLPAATQDKPPVDAARNGLSVKSGDRITGAIVTLTEGAASLRGRVVPATEGARLPDRLRLHLIPAEKESADDVVRFSEVAVQSDGLFAFSNLAPGKYWMVIRRDADEAQSANVPRPVAWDAEARAKLLKEAETANNLKELQPCQRVTDYVLRYGPVAKPAAKSGEGKF